MDIGTSITFCSRFWAVTMTSSSWASAAGAPAAMSDDTPIASADFFEAFLVKDRGLYIE